MMPALCSRRSSALGGTTFPKSRGRGVAPFTMLELIVTLSVIAILMTVLMPRLLMARRRAGHAAWLGIKKSHQIDARCIVYYTFEEGEGAEIENLAKAAEVSSLFNPTDLDAVVMEGGLPCSTQWTRGRFRDKIALYFNGTDTSVHVPYHGALNELETQATVEAWVYASNLSGTRPIVVRGNDPGCLALYHNDGAGLGFELGGTVCYGPALEENKWYYVAGVYDENHLRLYVNGAEVASTAFSSAVSYLPPTAGLLIGSSWGRHWRGTIDGIALLKEGLTPDEVKKHYELGRIR